MAYYIKSSKIYITQSKYCFNTNFTVNKANINNNIDILHNFFAQLQLSKVIKGNIVILKKDWFTFWNITKVIYYKHKD